jgi:hypothetical protein
METPTSRLPTDFARYLDFAESQHLQALAKLCQSTDDMNMYTQLLAHAEEVGELIKRRRYLIHGEDSSRAVADESDWQASTLRRHQASSR